MNEWIQSPFFYVPVIIIFTMIFFNIFNYVRRTEGSKNFFKELMDVVKILLTGIGSNVTDNEKLSQINIIRELVSEVVNVVEMASTKDEMSSNEKLQMAVECFYAMAADLDINVPVSEDFIINIIESTVYLMNTVKKEKIQVFHG